MNADIETDNLAALIDEAVKIKEEALTAFGALTPAQINWKPSAEEWSIGQCFDHLILTNRPYFPVFEKIAAGEQTRTLWERVPLLPAFFGRLIIGAVSPKSARKVKARPKFIPASSNVDAQIIGRFASHQEEFVRLMQATEKLPLEKIIITSAISSLVTYSLLDGYRILVTHERRHFMQAERVMTSEGFPL